VYYDAYIDKFVVDFGHAIQYEWWQLTEDIWISFSDYHSAGVTGRVKGIKVFSPHLGRSKEWLNQLDEVMGSTLVQKMHELERKHVSITEGEIVCLPRWDLSSLQPGWHRLHLEFGQGFLPKLSA
jgi:hypothetical protein